jgi:hypothetical protein
VGHYRFVRFPSRLKLTIGQISGLRSFMEKTNDKREYRRGIAVFQKGDGKTYDCIARGVGRRGYTNSDLGTFSPKNSKASI